MSPLGSIGNSLLKSLIACGLFSKPDEIVGGFIFIFPPPETELAMASIVLRCSTSEQALYRLLRLFFKSQSALIPLLLLSKSQPLTLGCDLGLGAELKACASILF